MSNTTKYTFTDSTRSYGIRPPVNPNRGGFAYIINCLYILSIIGLCVKIFFGNTPSASGSYGPASATIWGYGLVVLSIISLLFVVYTIFNKIDIIEKGDSLKGNLNDIWRFLKIFLGSSFPSMVTIIILIWIIGLNISFYELINKGRVSDEYYSLSSGSTFLFVFQIICLFQYLKGYIANKTYETGDKTTTIDQTQLIFAVYFIAILNLIATSMMTIILNFFSTDG